MNDRGRKHASVSSRSHSGCVEQATSDRSTARSRASPDPLIGATIFGHDGFNRQVSVTDPNAVKTATAYDGLNRVTSVTQGADSPEELTTTHQYNLFGDLHRAGLRLV